MVILKVKILSNPENASAPEPKEIQFTYQVMTWYLTTGNKNKKAVSKVLSD